MDTITYRFISRTFVEDLSRIFRRITNKLDHFHPTIWTWLDRQEPILGGAGGGTMRGGNRRTVAMHQEGRRC
jgi:hypothetical protein